MRAPPLTSRVLAGRGAKIRGGRMPCSGSSSPLFSLWSLGAVRGGMINQADMKILKGKTLKKLPLASTTTPNRHLLARDAVTMAPCIDPGILAECGPSPPWRVCCGQSPPFSFWDAPSIFARARRDGGPVRESTHHPFDPPFGGPSCPVPASGGRAVLWDAGTVSSVLGIA